ncbi:hypothetical protein B296_00012258, partial [Ensete ventricosum]
MLQLRVGNGEDFMPSRGRWNFNHKVVFIFLLLLLSELLIDFYTSSGKRKPENIIIFRYARDGVSESQFVQVLNIELDQIIELSKEHYCNFC